MEKECLKIPLRGLATHHHLSGSFLAPAPPAGVKKPLADRRLLVLSRFGPEQSRATSDNAARRNDLVAALADEVHIVYATPGGHLEQLSRRLRAW